MKSDFNEILYFIKFKNITFFFILIALLMSIGFGLVYLEDSNAQSTDPKDENSVRSLCDVGTSQTSQATPIPGTLPVIADLGFEAGDISTGWEWGGIEYPRSAAPNELETIPAGDIFPQRSHAGNILKVTVEPDDCINGGARAEVYLNSLHLHQPNGTSLNPSEFIQGDDSWFHWFVLFPDAPNPEPLIVKDEWHIVTQTHGEYSGDTHAHLCHSSNTPVPCSLTPWGFNIRNFDDADPKPVLQFNVLDQSNPGTGFETLWSTNPNHTNNFQLNHWYEFLLHIKWQPCTKYDLQTGECTENNGGTIQLWVDGNSNPVVNKTDRYTMPSFFDPNAPQNIGETDPVYFKQGLYHCKKSSCNPNNQPVTQTIYYDDTVVALCDNPSQKIYHPATHSCVNRSSPYP